MNTARGSRLPSSFEFDEEVYNEGRWEKFWRLLKREPLVPIGTGLTCYALWRAYKSMRKGTHHETNRMFRMRIYGQAFTLVCMCGYAFFYAEERALDKAQAAAQAERKALEKKERWIRELEERDRIEREERARALAKRRRQIAKDAKDTPSVANCALERPKTGRLGVFEAVIELISR